MKTTEMHNILYNKLKAENTHFTKQDIYISKVNENKYIITVKDFEPFSFIINLSIEDYNGKYEKEYEVTISKYYNNEYDEFITLTTSKKAYDIKYALIELGYYIGTRF